ncbi:serine/threonine-protein kinase dbf2 [Coemansia sp. RSA 2531]|nr:serine/threonine-protein kinase dbf2 [Coemansia sp. RSA 2531]
MAERGSMDTRPGREDDDSGSEQPWLAYAEANGMMHTFETIGGRSESPSSMLGISQTPTDSNSMASSSRGGSLSRRSAFLNTIDPSVRRRVEAAQVYFLEYYVDQLTYIANRRQRLERFKSAMRSWLVRLLYSFQDARHLYLAMEFVPGGDIRSLLIQNDLFRHQVAQFYVAEMLAAVAALHSFGYFHRDLKPENFLVDATGHVKLTDFGLSHGHLSRGTLDAMRKTLDRVKDQDVIHRSSSERRSLSKQLAASRMDHRTARAFSIVGSPDYMAPEILYTSLAADRQHTGRTSDRSSRCSSASDPLADAHLGYDFRVDYWSLGCILYEFYASYSPFTGPTADDVWRNVYHWEEVLHRPDFASKEADDNLTPEAWDLIAALVCHRDIRLCSLQEVASHSYFRGMNMFDLRGTLTPPFTPALKSDADNAHFDDFSDPASMAVYKDVNNKWKDLDTLSAQSTPDVDPASFIGFTYKHNRQHRYI